MVVARAEYNYYPEEIQINRPKQVVKNRKKVRSIDKSMYITMAIIFMLTSLFILFGYAKITAVRIDITNLERQKVELSKMKQDLIGELEGIKNTTKISEEATYSLGMMYPKEGQVVYVSIDGNNTVTTAKAGLSEQLRRVLSIFSSVFRRF